MTGAWDAKVEISTADATLNLRNLKTEAVGLAASLRALDLQLKDGQANIDAVAASFTRLVVEQRAAAAGQKDLAAGAVAQARADGIEIANNAKKAESAAKVATEEQRKYELEQLGIAKVATEDLKAVAQAEANQVKRDALAAKEISNQEKKAAAAAKAAADQVKTDRANNTDLTLSDNLSNSRYLLYDVGATYGVLSAALLAIPAATAAVAASYQKDFAQVLRVTHESAAESDALRQSLKDLATQIPLSFGELANITQIGAQMGIATDKLANFTEVTAKFTATTGVATETAATLFGRLQNMFPDESKAAGFFNSIGSAIAQVGADTVATDPQIASMSVQIAAVGSSAGFTASQTIGLSAALASVAVQPELARSSLTRLFGKLNTDVATGSTKMNDFASVLKMTSAQASALWQSDPSQFFTKLMSGLHDIQSTQGGVGLTQALSSLGVTSVRDVSVLTRLAVGYDTLATSMTSADDAARNGTALDQMSKPVFTTMASQLKEIGSAIQNLMDTLGSGSLGPMTQFLDLIKSLITGFDHMIATVPGFKEILGLAAILSIVAGAFLGLKTAQAFALAGLVGFQQVAGKAGLSGAMSMTGILQQLAKTWLMAGGASTDAATKMVASGGTLKAALVAASGNAKQLNETFTETGDVAGVTANKVGLLRGALTALAGVSLLAAISALTSLIFGMQAAGQQSEDMGKAIAAGLKTGAADGITAITDQLKNLKINPSTDGAYGIFNWDKSFSDVAKEAGVSMNDIVAAISHGKAGIQEFQGVLDTVAKSKGFKSFDDWSNSARDGGVAAQALANHVKDAIDQTAKAADDTKIYTAAQQSLGAAMSDTIDPITGHTKAETDAAAATKAADDAVKTYIDDLFALVDASMATNDSMEKLGAGLRTSPSMNINDANGRDNIKNLQDTLKNAAIEQQQLIDSGQQTAQQAATNYAQFIDGLMQKLASLGVDTSQIQNLADNAKGAFDDEIQKLGPAAMQIKVDKTQVGAATAYLDSVVAKYGTTNLDILLKETGSEDVGNNVFKMEQYIENATGTPYVVKVNSDTDAANQNVHNMVTYTMSLFGHPFVATVDVNASPGEQALQLFAQYAASVVNGIIDGINTIGMITNLGKGANPIGHVGWGAPPPPKAPAAVAAVPNVPAPPPQVASGGAAAANDATNKSLDALTNGYNNAAKAAGNAGAAGQKAGKDAANGINAATAAVNDYASRLQTSLTSAYDKQYGMQIATDNYQKALNAIVDKRAADLKSISDLIDKQKQLNDAMNTDLVDANKAKIEQDISLKYGEGARAADYGVKAQTALDNAAAKKKEMDADAASQKVLQDGIGNLTGNTNAAIANREAARGLETQMLAMIDAYAKTGASQQQVTEYAAKLGAQFQQDVVQTGFSSQAVQNLTGDMGRYVDAVKAVPFRVNTNTSTSGTGPATDALNGVKNAALGIPTNRNVEVTFTGASLWQTPNFTSDHQPIYDVLSNGKRNGTKLFNEGGQVEGFADGGQIPGTPPANPRADNLMAQVDGKGMIRVRSKEFIQPQEAVDYYGLDFMNQIRKMQLPRFNFGGQVGGSGGGAGRAAGGPMLVELTAQNIAAIARLADQQINLYTNDELIAQSAGRGNTVLASKGFS